jgi:hypothetical protein
MWLRDALPHHITREGDQKPCARVMIYGYESSLPQSQSTQNLEDLATSFHSSLLGLISAANPNPIIFIAHSLGGLILKQVSPPGPLFLKSLLMGSRFSYHFRHRRRMTTKSSFEPSTGSSFSAFLMTEWISVRLSLWWGMGRIGLSSNPSEAPVHRF